MRRPCGWLLPIVFTLPVPHLEAQRSARDSASSLATTADSLTSLGTEQGLRSAMVLRQKARALFRQTSQATEEGTQLQRLGIAFLNLGEVDSARSYFSLALAVRSAAGDRVGRLRSINALALVHQREGHYDSALTMYHVALDSARALGDPAEEVGPMQNIANVFLQRSVPDSTFFYNRRAAAIAHSVSDVESEGQIESNMSLLWKDLGRPDSGLAHARQALAIAGKNKDYRTTAHALENVSIMMFELGETDSALVYYRMAMAAYVRLGDVDSQRLLLNQRGIIFDNLGQSDSALAVFRTLVSLGRSDHDPSTEARALSNLALAFKRAGKMDSALVRARASVALHRKLEEQEGTGLPLHTIGTVHERAGRLDSALVYFREVQQVGIATETPMLQSAGSNGIGKVLMARGQVDSARHYLNAGLALDRAAEDPMSVGESLQDLAELNVRAGDYHSAAAYYDSSATTTAGVRQRVSGEFDRVTLAESEITLYEGWALAWLAQAPRIGASNAGYAALAAAERGRARALFDLMRDTTVVPPVGADLAAEGRRLVKSVASDHAIVVSYQPTPTALIVIAANGDSIDTERVEIDRDSLSAVIAGFREALQFGGSTRTAPRMARSLERTRGVVGVKGGGAGASTREISSLLIPSRIRDRIASASDLLIVPQGTVALVPFAALVLSDSARPLGVTHSIHYAPSLAIAREVESRPNALGGADRLGSAALVAGNPSMPTVRSVDGARLRLNALPYAAVEADSVASQLHATALKGAAATEAEVRRRLPLSSVVHLATHGFAYSAESQARRSFVALAPGSGRDGLLTVGEILDDPALQLHADLVVLSACETGLGDLKQAEGTIGLQRAFLARGARSVLVSLWCVCDEATMLLMQRFYTHWINDSVRPTKAEALRRAQADVRGRPAFKDPQSWAAFQLVGAR
jgi:tetratricopeptide (TPR) repeat protein